MDIIAGNLAGMTDISATISPPSLLMSTASSPSSYSRSPTSAPIPPPPLPSITTSNPSSSTSVISRPPKRHVRPRATTEKEKEERLEERKLANRTAAKQSRERQKQAMEEALRENERLKEENSKLLLRLSNLEQRMQEMESQQNKRRRLNEEGGSSTHQPARPMSTTEPQCPTSFLQQRHPTYSKTRSTLPQTRLIVYALQILMHSFVLSLHFPAPLLNHFLLSATTLPCSHQRHSVIPKRNRLSSLQRMSLLHGYATPNRDDLSGAIRNAMILRRERAKSSSITLGRMVGKDWLRLVRRRGRRENGKYIRLIIKKGKRMNK